MLPRTLVAASLEPIMLTLLDERDMYGYQIIQRVHDLSDGKIQWKPNTLYPLLHDLENTGLVKAYWVPSDTGPDRKYYCLTARGRQALEHSKQHWLDLNRILARLWGPELTLSGS